MRNLPLLLATGLSLLSACDNGAGVLPDPPVLTVTSPARSLMQNGAGKVTVTGTVTPNPAGVAIQKVSVNNVAANVQADGSFSIDVNVPAGATLIHTEALDVDGGKATDTRSVEAGMIRKPGAMVEKALTAAVSKEAFAKIASVAGPLIKGMDLKPMIAPMQPMVNAGSGCNYGQLFVDDVTMSNAIITLVPVDGGLQFSAEIDGLDVPGHMNYKVVCIGGSSTTRITASKVVVGGTLMVSPNGMNGFTTELDSPTVQLTNLNISASGVPGAILGILPLDSAIEYIVPKVAGMFMGPMMNQALGALGGPKKLNLLGKTMDVQVAPSDISFTTDNALVTLDMMMLIEGTENSKGFIFTDNGMPNMNPGQGLQLGIADDLANEMLSQLVATGLLNLTMPANAGTFDATKIEMTSPPMIAADPADGKMRLILPDMTATFMLQGTPVAKAAINVKLDLAIAPANNGFGVAIQLGTPDINIDVLPDIANETRFSNADLSEAVKLCLDSQIASVTVLLGGIPLPSMAGMTMKDVSVSADSGYVMLKGTLQ